MSNEAWSYLETQPAADAPISDNPSGMYCASCRSTGVSHCAHPEYCGGNEANETPRRVPQGDHPPMANGICEKCGATWFGQFHSCLPADVWVTASLSLPPVHSGEGRPEPTRIRELEAGADLFAKLIFNEIGPGEAADAAHSLRCALTKMLTEYRHGLGSQYRTMRLFDPSQPVASQSVSGPLNTERNG